MNKYVEAMARDLSKSDPGGPMSRGIARTALAALVAALRSDDGAVEAIARALRAKNPVAVRIMRDALCDYLEKED